MTSRTWLLCGVPRSGTSLCCRLTAGAPDTVALSEPIKPATLDADPEAACAGIRRFADAARAGLLVHRRAWSVQVAGRLDDNPVSDAPSAVGPRPPRGARGNVRFDKPLSAGFTLVIKHNALFAALLGRLAEAFPVLAIVRNPVATLASWQTVDLPVRGGRVPQGERFDAELRRRLEMAPDTLRRQVAVLDWFLGRFRDHVPHARILRYEDVVSSGGGALFQRLGTAAPPAQPLAGRNANALYRAETADALLAALQAGDRCWSPWYSDTDCERVAAAIRDRT